MMQSGFSQEVAVTKPASGKNTSAWTQKMRSLEQTLQALLIDLSSDENYNSPKNFKRIENNAALLAKLAHGLEQKEIVAPDSDPTIKIIASQFSREADLAYKTLKWGHRVYARESLKSMSNYCLACHTRNSQGPSFQSINAPSAALAQLQPYEKANFLAATRQFDQALTEYEKIIAEPASLERRPFQWERAMRSALAIAVRVKKDPARALSIVEKVLGAPQAAFYLKEQATQWKSSIEAWKKEPTARPQTEEGFYAQAVKLIGEAQALQQYPADRSADILYLRASSVVHDLLGFAPKGTRVSDALYLAGLSYEVMRDLNLWDQHEYYYLACILNSPHSEKARQCYRHYEQSVYLGYTGSGGMNLPAEVKRKLNELELLSRPQPKTIQ